MESIPSGYRVQDYLRSAHILHPSQQTTISPDGSFRLLKLARSSELSSRGGFRNGGNGSCPGGWGDEGCILSPALSNADRANFSSLTAPSSPSTLTTSVTVEEATPSSGKVIDDTVPATQPEVVSGSQTRVPLAYVAAMSISDFDQTILRMDIWQSSHWSPCDLI